MVQFVRVTGPACWASYFINGDASGLETGEQAKADAWMAREGLRSIVSDATDEDGEPEGPRFTWSMRLHAPELGCEGGDVLDYIADPLNPSDWPASALI